MFATQISFRLWLSRWFGIRHDSDSSDGPDLPVNAGHPADADGPLFSLGDTKQDIVVSYRRTKTDEL